MRKTIPLWPLVLAALALPAVSSTVQPQPLLCAGTEPFWSLDLREVDSARYSTPDQEAVAYAGAFRALPPRREWTWRGRAADADGDLVAFLRERPCSDNMSDAMHPYAINVSLPDGAHLGGCCRLATSASLENTTWRLVDLPGQASLPAGQGNAITATFSEGRVQGFSGCNQFAGGYALEADRLVLGPLGGSMMACPEPAMSLEQRFLKAFSGSFAFSVTGNQLLLEPGGEEPALRFEREAPPRLDGVEWEVTGYNNGRQAVVSPLPGSRLTVSFLDGTVTGNSGCNNFHGTYSAAGKRLAIQPLASTRRACEADIMAQEQAFLAALQGAATWDIVRGMLDVHRADGERALTANAAGE